MTKVGPSGRSVASISSFENVFVVIPSINGLSLLRRLFPTIDTAATKIVVVDQASADGTEAWCREVGINCVQAGRQLTFCEAVNVGIKQAIAYGAEFICVLNNDTEFCGDVLHGLHSIIVEDPSLASIAPSQLVLTKEGEPVVLVYRVFWDLLNIHFMHDIKAPIGIPHRLDSDFCELTCAMLRVSALEAVGFLDEEYGFYYEDADLGFRLRESGFVNAYAPRLQIKHYAGSTFGADLSPRKLQYVEKNRILFARKHLGLCVSYHRSPSDDENSWSVINRNLHSALGRHGMIAQKGPKLSFDHAAGDADILFTVWETTKLPKAWVDGVRNYMQILVPSTFNATTFNEIRNSPVALVPLGVETDIFNPWGPRLRLSSGPLFLCFVRNQYRKAIDVTLEAWGRATATGGFLGTLVLFGKFLEGIVSGQPTNAYRIGKVKIEEHADRKIILAETIEPLTDEELATVYRSVTFTLLNSRSEGFGFTVVESMACGTPCIFPDYGATADFVFDGALTISGNAIKADYSDKGFDDVGEWWQPDLNSILQALCRASSMSALEYEILSKRGTALIFSKFTWRHTVFNLRRAVAPYLTRQQVNDPVRLVPDIPPLLEPPMQKSHLPSLFLTRLGRGAIRFSEIWQSNGIIVASRRALGTIKRRLLRALVR